MNAISAREALNAPALEIALVNNMPDQAVDATRAQFVNYCAPARKALHFVCIAIYCPACRTAKPRGALCCKVTRISKRCMCAAPTR